MNKDGKNAPIKISQGEDRKKNNVKEISIIICILAAVSILFTACFNNKETPTVNPNEESMEVNEGDEEAEEASPDTIAIGGLEDSLPDLLSPNYDVVTVVKSVSQSVVSINVTTAKQDTSDTGGYTAGSGSGIIINEDSRNIYISTNYHVIQNVDTITISTDDDNEVPAYYIGSSAQSDLAVISVAKTDLGNAGIKDYAVAVFGDSDLLEVGEYVVAIGNALGEGQTVTDGIVSAKNKVITVGGMELTVLQTNAAINQGNSGGPLSNMDGEIIGINTAKLSKEGVEGMGYSIPINDAKAVIDNIMQNPEENAEDPEENTTDPNGKPELGVKGITITDEMMEQYDFQSKGVYVVETVENSGAESAGLQRGDIIIAFESVTITTVEELKAEIQKCSNGDVIKIYIYREGSASPSRLNATIKQ